MPDEKAERVEWPDWLAKLVDESGEEIRYSTGREVTDRRGNIEHRAGSVAELMRLAKQEVHDVLDDMSNAEARAEMMVGARGTQNAYALCRALACIAQARETIGGIHDIRPTRCESQKDK